MKDEWVTVLSLAIEVGSAQAIGPKKDCSSVRQQIKAQFPDMLRKTKQPQLGIHHFVWVIPKEEKERVLSFLRPLYAEQIIKVFGVTKAKEDWEQKCASELEAQGYVTIVTKKAGLPDVIAFRKRNDGGFDLIFREAKGPGDSLHKEQHEVLTRLKSEGVDAEVRWF